MKIKFKKGDPREGMVVEFNSSRGQELIDAGSAVEFKGEVPAPDAVEKSADEKPAAKSPAKKAAAKDD